MKAEQSPASVGRGRRWQLLAGLLLPVVSLLALGATVETSQFPGETSTIVERSGDGLVPSFRYRGTQRFDTAQLIGEDTFESPGRVLIARGDLFPDSLSGSFVAGNLDAPLLLTESRRLTPDTRDSLTRLDPDKVLLLGGTGAIHRATEDQIAALGYPTERIAGPDRFATARQAATFRGTTVGTRSDGQFSGRAAIVARADRFADALVAGSVSYAARFPLLLTTANTLHQDARAALNSLNIDTVIIPGGTSAVSANVESQIEAMGITVDRVSGVDRVETSVNFALFLRDELGFDIEHISLSRGTRFADALALGPHAGEEVSPIVLTANETTLGGAGSVAELLELTCGVGNMHVGGGFEAITPGLEQTMRQKAVDTGAICDIIFEEGSGPNNVIVNPLGADSRTVRGTVTDNAGNPSNDQSTVRWQVFRGDFQQENGDVELLDEDTTTTDSNSDFEFTYSAPDERAWDYVVACTIETSNDDVGQDPGTCLDDPDSTTLRVDDRRPQNLGNNLASNFQIKQWGREGLGPQEQTTLLAEATGVQGSLGGSELLSQPTSRVELPGPNGETADEETGGLEIGVLDDTVRAGVTTTLAKGNLNEETATARATTADVEVLGLPGGPLLNDLLGSVDPSLLEDVNLDLLNSLLGGGDGGGTLDGLSDLDTSLLGDPAMVQQLDGGDGHLLAAELIDVATTTNCQTGPYDALDEASDTRFVNAEVLGQQIPVEPDPNTGIKLEGLVEVVINEVEPTSMSDGDGEFGYEVRGLHVQILDTLLSGGLDVTISEALTSIDCAGQTFNDPNYDTSGASLLADGTQIPGGVDWQTVNVDPRPFLDKLEAMTDRQLFTEAQRAEIDRKYEAFVQSQQQ